MRGLVSSSKMRADQDDITTASRGFGETMSNFPSEVSYHASAAHRQDLLADATAARCAAEVRNSATWVPDVVGALRRRIGSLLVVLGTWLLRVDDASELTPALEP
jgi:hypothetical protein